MTSFRKIATAAADRIDVQATLLDAILEAHQALVSRQEGEVTTAVVVVADGERARVVSSGDSAALHFDGRGRIRAVTNKHEVKTGFGASCLTHAVGLEPEAAAPETYEWTMEAGDRLLLCSDGLLDAGLDLEAVGRALVASPTAEGAVNTIASRVLKRMALLQAKPDNLTIVAMRLREAPEDPDTRG